ncbi:MAG: hypothetical protein QM710_13135 [Flavobacterium sp.]
MKLKLLFIFLFLSNILSAQKVFHFSDSIYCNIIKDSLISKNKILLTTSICGYKNTLNRFKGDIRDSIGRVWLDNIDTISLEQKLEFFSRKKKLKVVTPEEIFKIKKISTYLNLKTFDSIPCYFSEVTEITNNKHQAYFVKDYWLLSHCEIEILFGDDGEIIWWGMYYFDKHIQSQNITKTLTKYGFSKKIINDIKSKKLKKYRRITYN